MTSFLNGFGGFALVIGIFVLFFAWQYFVRGYFIYQDHGNNLVYKERDGKRLSFYIVGRYKDEIYNPENYQGVDIHVPADNGWKTEMPDWAKERREIILRRLEKDFRGRDEVYFIEYANQQDVSVVTYLRDPSRESHWERNTCATSREVTKVAHRVILIRYF